MSWRMSGDKEMSEEKILREEKQRLEQVSQKLLITRDALRRIDGSILDEIVGGGASANCFIGDGGFIGGGGDDL